MIIIGKRNIKSITSMGVFTKASLIRSLLHPIELSLLRGNSFREVEQNSFSFNLT